MNSEYYINLVKARLGDYNGHLKNKNEHGNVIYVESEIYNIEHLAVYLNGSLQRFNMLFGKQLDLEDHETHQFTDLIVQGAVITALAGKALIERGRELTTSDNGINFTPPDVSSILMRQWEIELVDYQNKVEFLLKKIIVSLV